MRLLSRFDIYLCEAVLACFAVFGFAFCGLFVLGDAAQRIIRWSYSEIPPMTFLGCLIAYYVVALPSILVRLMPLCWTVAVGVTVFFLQRRNELVAFHVQGVSVYRVMRPVFVLSIGVGGLVALCNEVIVPRLAEHVRSYEQIVAWRSHGDKLIVPVDNGKTFYWIGATNTREKRLDGVVMVSYDEAGKTSDALWAKEGIWQEAGLTLRDVWRPWGGFTRGRREALHYGELPAPVSLTQDEVLAAETPADMNSARGIRSLIKGMPGNRFFEMAFYEHFVMPIAPVLFVLMAIPLVVGNEFTEGASARGILICLALCTSYYAVKSLCHNVGATGNISTLNAVMLPVVLFGAIGFYMFSSVRT